MEAKTGFFCCIPTALGAVGSNCSRKLSRGTFLKTMWSHVGTFCVVKGIFHLLCQVITKTEFTWRHLIPFFSQACGSDRPRNREKLNGTMKLNEYCCIHDRFWKEALWGWQRHIYMLFWILVLPPHNFGNYMESYKIFIYLSCLMHNVRGRKDEPY